jgi:hypothetical protein
MDAILSWIEGQDPLLAEAIRGANLETALRPEFAGGGVTFFYPEDQAYRKEVIDEITGHGTDGNGVSYPKFLSLIAPVYLGERGDFSRLQPVGSLYGKVFKPVGADYRGVTIESDPGQSNAVLSIAPTFARGRNEKLAVWIVAPGGRMPLTGEAYTPAAPRRAGERPPARIVNAADPDYKRRILAYAVEDDFDRCMKRDRCQARNPYLAKVVSLLNFLKMAAPGHYEVAMTVVDFDPIVSFYLLLEPYKSPETKGFLFPGDVLFGDNGWNGAELYVDALREYLGHFDSLPRQAQPTATDAQNGAKVTPRVFSDGPAVYSQTDAVRLAFNSKVRTDPRSGPSLVQNAYAALVAGNTIAGLGPVLPDAALGGAGGKKLWQDEFRFYFHECFECLMNTPHYTSAELIPIIYALRTTWRGDDYRKEIYCGSVEKMQKDFAARPRVGAVARFVNSTYFLYMPRATALVGNDQGSLAVTDLRVYNHNVGALNRVRLATGMIHPAGISPQALLELRYYAQTHGGRLPLEVTALATSPPAAAPPPTAPELAGQPVS